jgi:hypothetical protein
MDFSANATHIRAGEVTAQLISCQNYSYRFKITGYTDTGSDVLFGGGEINYGDGEIDTFETGNPDEFLNLGDEKALNVFYKTHAFPGPGMYKISFREFNRNDNIVNMDNSVNTPFYIETVIVIDPFFGCDNTPILLNPPIDDACVGVAFFHNAGAYDADGDSISYEFTIPKQDQDIPVVNYRFPDAHDRNFYSAQNEDMTGPATFTLDRRTGNVVWDAPGGEGEYNFAFKIIEWRKIEGEWFELGYVTRDMQVNVLDCDNERPELIMPPDTCVVAGTLLEQDIMAEDPDGDPIIMDAFGSVFELINNPASFTPSPPVAQPSPATLSFTWPTNCSHIDQQPYQVNVKALDQPPVGKGAKLADFDSWFVTVVGPSPEGLMAEQGQGNKVQLSWDNYLCQNADFMQVWRRVDSYAYEPGNCELGIPENGDYELVETIDIRQTTYIDDNMGQGLEYGVRYCYRLVAVFETIGGGESVVSAEACTILEEFDGEFGALTTNVSIENTDAANGEIYVRWTSPFDIDKSKYPTPYSYEVYRSSGFQPANLALVSNGKIADTVFVDTGLNTSAQVYNYTIVVYDAAQTAIDTTSAASSVRLELTPITGAMELQWSADVPWTNFSQQHPNHLIYRNRVDANDPEKLVLIDSVDVTASGASYIDDGSATGNDKLDDTELYCYYIITKGTYGNDKLATPFLNKSQVICAQPNDTVPPCVPPDFTLENLNINNECTEFLNGQPCDFEDFFNELNWQASTDPGCESDVRSYNVYFSETGEEGTYNIVANVNTTSFLHENLDSFKGCYFITAVDRSGNESEPTEIICNDNCPFFELPNVFTPNGDDYNDTFTAFNTFDVESNQNKCPRFVKNVVFKVYTRGGQEVYNSESSVERNLYINWSGKTDDGVLLPAGVYYYHATVTFDVLDPAMSEREYKGWVHILY